MEKYIRKFKEDETVKLDDSELAGKIIQWFKENPYPSDHQGVHLFAESLGLEADIIETYIYAIVSCFVSGGNFNKSGKKEEDFDPEEIKAGMEIESEHIDKDNNNPVIQHIADFFRKRIAMDHIAEATPISYYDKLKVMEDEIKNDRGKYAK